MEILKYKFYIILFVCVFSQPISASPSVDESGNSVVHRIGSSGDGSEVFNLLDTSSGVVLDSAGIIDWHFFYDDTNGTGSFNILANSTKAGNIDVSSALLSTNTDGSLHVNGFVSFVDGSVLSYFTGDIVATAEADFVSDVTLFSLNTLDVLDVQLSGLQLFSFNDATSSPLEDEFILAVNSFFVGGLVDPLLANFINANPDLVSGAFNGNSTALSFQLNSSALAAVDSVFPVYSPVPLPAAFWLFFSGLLGLITLGKRQLHVAYVTH